MTPFSKRTITHANTKVLLNTRPGAGEEGKKEVKSSNLNNTSDDDCSKRKNFKPTLELPSNC